VRACALAIDQRGTATFQFIGWHSDSEWRRQVQLQRQVFVRLRSSAARGAGC